MIETLGLSNFTSTSQQSENCVLLHFGEGDEDNRQLIYSVFPGIKVQNSYLHTNRCSAAFRYAEKTISIDFCLSGQVEWEAKNEAYCTMGQGDIRVSAQSGWEGEYEFPTRNYQGVTVTVQMEEAQKSLEELRPWFYVEADSLARLLDLRKRDAVFPADQEVEQIFLVLIALCDRGDLSGMRLKVLELLLLLPQRVGRLEPEGQRPYFPKSVVEKVRTIKELLCRELNCKKSLAELAEEYQLSETMLKRCFHMMYGNSVYAFVKNHRLQAAARALAETDRPIMEIALEVGYENPSKFSAAFRKCYGQSPRQYRAGLHSPASSQQAAG